MSKKRYIWIVQLGVNGPLIFTESSKFKAVDEIKRWSNGYTSPYTIETDLEEIKMNDGRLEFIHITMNLSKKAVTLHVNRREIGSGCNLIHLTTMLEANKNG